MIKTKQKVSAIVCLCFLAQHGSAQQQWQHLQDPTAREVAAAWKTPPSEYGPQPYYGMGGPLTLEVIQRDLDTMRALGFRAVTVQAGFNMPFDYLSPEYFHFFSTFVAEAKKRDMRIWIVDDAGYPSGFAGGKFTTEAPELRMQALVVGQKFSVSRKAELHEAVKPDAVSAIAISADGAAQPIPLANGKLDWAAPEGEWTVLVVEHQFRTSPTRSDTNNNRVKDTTQSLEDYLSATATKQYLNFTHEQYKKYVGAEFGKTILGFRGDEPDYSISGLPWTQTSFSRFEQIKGYDVRPFVGAFVQTPSPHNPGVAVKLTPEQIRARADYYDVFSQLFAENFFKPQGDWCAANHMEYQVHLNHEEMEMQLVRSEGEFFRDFRNVQVPGIDAIWHQIWKDTISDFPRLASSVSHVYGKPRAFTETFAAYRPVPDLPMARYILDEQFVRGVNLVEAMHFPATANGPRPAPSYMGLPGFSDLLIYVQRLSYLLSMGRPDATVALYLPSSSMWMGDTSADRAFVATEQMLSEHQIDFDIVSEDALARDLKAEKGSFRTLSGNEYFTVILPGASVISEEAQQRLKSFAAHGGKVVVLERTPGLISGRNYRDARESKPQDFSWATTIAGTLPATPTPPANPPDRALQPQIIPAGMLAGVSSAIVKSVVQLDEPDTAIRVMKRRLKDADLYLFFNEGSAARTHAMILMSKGKAETWNPQTAEITSMKQKSLKGKLAIDLPLGPYETRVVVLRH